MRTYFISSFLSGMNFSCHNQQGNGAAYKVFCLERTLFAAYEFGREFADTSVSQNAAKILSMRIADYLHRPMKENEQ